MFKKKQNWYFNDRKYHFIYKTTNLVNAKYYIGMHSTNDLNDGYLGSGTRLWRSIQHYGKDNFKVEILEFFPDRESLRKREAELVDKEKLRDPLCMNLCEGGYGSLTFQACSAGGKKNGWHIRKLGNYGWKRQDYKSSLSFKESVSTGLKEKFKTGWNPWLGKKHREESKQKIGIANSIHQAGEKNSQFNTLWISNLETKNSKKVYKDTMIDLPWVKGRNVWNKDLAFKKS